MLVSVGGWRLRRARVSWRLCRARRRIERWCREPNDGDLPGALRLAWLSALDAALGEVVMCVDGAPARTRQAALTLKRLRSEYTRAVTLVEQIDRGLDAYKTASDEQLRALRASYGWFLQVPETRALAALGYRERVANEPHEPRISDGDGGGVGISDWRGAVAWWSWEGMRAEVDDMSADLLTAWIDAASVAPDVIGDPLAGGGPVDRYRVARGRLDAVEHAARIAADAGSGRVRAAR
jgi:hypothetical protein